MLENAFCKQLLPGGRVCRQEILKNAEHCTAGHPQQATVVRNRIQELELLLESAAALTHQRSNHRSSVG